MVKKKRSYRQRFHLCKRANPIKEGEPYQRDAKTFDEYISQDKHESSENFMGSQFETICYDIEKYNKGLIFLLKLKENATQCKIVSEIVLDNDYQPNELYEKYGGIVVSHWISDNNIIGVSHEILNLMKQTYGERGFGDRTSTKSVGMNIYHGNKQTNATVGNPL